jgi:hypothetical protein
MEYEHPQQHSSSDQPQRKKVSKSQPDTGDFPIQKPGRSTFNIANIPAYPSTQGSTLEQSLQSEDVNRDILDSTTLIAHAQAGLVAFGPVGVAIAVGVTGITISIWLNSPSGRKFLGEITDVVGRGVDATLNELQRILNQGGELAKQQYHNIEEYIKNVVNFAKGGKRDREREDREFKDAVKKIEKIIGRKLSVEEERALHDAITKQGYTFWEIVITGVQMFGESEDLDKIPRNAVPEGWEWW